MGPLCFFDHDDDLHTDSDFWYRFLDRIKGDLDEFLKLTLVPDQIKDHDKSAYVKLLEKLVELTPCSFAS